jgi:hypothetical protein
MHHQTAMRVNQKCAISSYSKFKYGIPTGTWSNIAVHSVIQFLSVKCMHWWRFHHPPVEVYRAHVMSQKCVLLSITAGQMLTISSVPDAQAHSLQRDNVGLTDVPIKTTDP